MSKRQADKQMTQETCDEEDEVIEAGVFTPADDSLLKDRIIKKAKRNLPSSSTPTSAFSGFSGFVTGGSSPFLTINKNTPISNGKTSVTQASKVQTLANSNGQDNTAELYQNVKELNNSFLKFLQEHHTKNNYCDFTPVIKDYENHFKELKLKYSSKKLETTKTVLLKSNSLSTFSKQDSSNEKAPSTATFSFGGMNKSPFSSNSPTKPTTGFSFGLSSNTATPTTQPTTSFSFGLSKNPDANSSLFSFGVANALAKQKENQETNVIAKNDDDNYEPPKNDFQPVVEKDALYSKRCKLFYKISDDFVDMGVGTLYLKKLEDKTQLLVRNDTSIGKVILNIVLNSSLPIKRMGKNNVCIVCIPHPPLNTKNIPNEDSKAAIPMLFRVKTSEEADELLQKFNEYKC